MDRPKQTKPNPIKTWNSCQVTINYFSQLDQPSRTNWIAIGFDPIGLQLDLYYLDCNALSTKPNQAEPNLCFEIPARKFSAQRINQTKPKYLFSKNQSIKPNQTNWIDTFSAKRIDQTNGMPRRRSWLLLLQTSGSRDIVDSICYKYWIIDSICWYIWQILNEKPTQIAIDVWTSWAEILRPKMTHETVSHNRCFLLFLYSDFAATRVEKTGLTQR